MKYYDIKSFFIGAFIGFIFMILSLAFILFIDWNTFYEIIFEEHIIRATIGIIIISGIGAIIFNRTL